MQTRSITRGFRLFVAVTGLLIAASGAAVQAQETAPPPPATDPPVAVHWREAPEYVALFSPLFYREAYRAYVADINLDEAIRLMTLDPAVVAVKSPGAWQANSRNPLDAFGAGGIYDRWKVARLYGANRPAVARGPRGAAGIVEESWTLISPFPSADLQTLNPGTLFIVLRIP